MISKKEIEKSILKLKILNGLLTGEVKKDYFEDINKILIYIQQLENKVEYLREKAEENAIDYYSEVSRNAKLEEKVNKIIEYCKKYEDEYEWIQTVDDEYQRMTGRALAYEEILNLIEGERA